MSPASGPNVRLMRLHCNLVEPNRPSKAAATRTYQDFQCDYLKRKFVCDLIRLKCKSLYKWLTIPCHSRFKSLSSSSSSWAGHFPLYPLFGVAPFQINPFFLFTQSVVRNSLSMQFFWHEPTRKDRPGQTMIRSYKDVVKFAFDKCSLSESVLRI